MNKDTNLIKVEFIYLPIINFALQQNRVSIIRLFSIENISGRELSQIQIKLSAEPGFTETINYRVEAIPANGTARIDDLKLKLSTDFFIQLTERMAGHISLEISAKEEVLFKNDYSIDVLAFDQWSGITILPEMLSAFVTPNHPIIASIQKRAALILEQLTGNPALDEYQSRNPNRVKNQLAAVYNAIAERNIVYSSVPASFESYGQRIRLVDNVLSQQLGTCLDMALLYASCLEAIGIHPLIIITQGHAFAGAWLVPDTFPDSVIDDNSFLTKRTAEGINEIILIEATCMNKGSNASFDEAVRKADDNLKAGDFVLALDVKRTRFSGIKPLPQRILHGDHWEVKECDDRLSEKEIINPEVISPYDLSILSSDIQVTKQLLWERKLLDLSLRNNLLNTRITKNTLQLISADLDKFEDALADGSEFRLMSKPADWENPLYDFGVYHSITSSDPITELIKSELTQKRLRTYLTEAELERALKHLYRSSRLSIEENGANTLYLALGLLCWYETPSSERPRYAPILLLPVEMVRKSAVKGFIIRSREEDTMLNITLLEMLRQNFGINVPGLDPLPTDESGVNVRLIYSIFRNSIKNQPKWDVEEQAILGIFSFNKFIMWNDIHNNVDKLTENKLVHSLISGKIEFGVDETTADASHLDKTLTPADIVLPISADSSQLEAVYEAVNDKTYILHGPPGTGKSQTITNIISNALYKGKRVLFVAEKMAALSVVQSRLDAIGLAPFCLELHSNKAKKTAVLSQLKRTAEIVRYRSPENFSREANRLFELRKELNVYIDALHKPYPFGLSLYEAITRFLSVEAECELKFPQSLFRDLTEERFLEWQDAVDSLVSVGNACGHPYNHPLTGINIAKYTPELKEKATEVLSESIQKLINLKSTASILDVITGQDNEIYFTGSRIETIDKLFSVLLRIPELTLPLLKEPRPGEMLLECREIVDHGKERDVFKAIAAEYFTDEIFKIDARVLLNAWDMANNSWFISKYFGRKKIYRQLTPYVHNGSVRQIDIRNILLNIVRYQEKRNLVNSQSERLQTLFGKFAKPGNEQWEKVQQIMDDFSLLDTSILEFAKDMTTASRLKENLARQLTGGIESFKKIHGNSMKEFQLALTEFTQGNTTLSNVLGVSDLYNDTPSWIEDALLRLNLWLANANRLKDWYQWLVISRETATLRIGFVAEGYKTQNIPTDQLKNSFYKGFYHAAIDFITANEPTLELFKGKLFNDVIAKYKELTHKFEEITKKELYAKLAANVPSFTIEAAQNSEVGILWRNIKSNGRGVSIRSLFDQIPTLLSRMCPCMLMSPISVAQYIDPSAEKFDLVIFDEASQMPTYEAVGAIARGKNMIIVGDPKQMPPTNFFSVNTVDEDNLDKEDLESILDDTLALSIPSRYLLWHYRSKHESLIAFSNSEYYDNKLLTFPSPDNIESKVSLVRVDGFYDKGKTRQNKQEAEAVIKEIERRLSDETLRRRSIGVVTFSSAQQILIEDLLSELFVARPDLEIIALECNEPLFIKNLENVQGDERDVILFSVGYGPDAGGQVSMNFGPLNREGGERRLNVAVSRARYEMMIFSTLRSDQIDLNRTSAIGVAGLKRFLEYAEKGQRISREKQGAITETASIEQVIANKLKDSGYEVHTNIGSSGYKIDIGIVDNENQGRYILGILCDGENYKRTKTARDREVVQNSVLQMLGWNICRIWTLDWWENPSEVMDTIETAIKNTKKQLPGPLIARNDSKKVDSIGGKESVISESSEIEEYSEFIGNPNSQEKYVYAYLPSVSSPTETFCFPENRNCIKRQIQNVIETEAPISRSLLCKRILNSWGIARLGSRIDAYFDELLKETDCYKKTDGDFISFWKNQEQMNTYQVFRSDSDRVALDLPPDEVANAVKYVLESQISLPTKDLSRITAQLFGFARTGNNVESAMYRGIKEAVKRKYIKIENGRAVIV